MPLPLDVFCRAAVFPRCVSAADRLEDSALLQVSGKGLGKRGISLASRYLCRDEDGVHDFGLRVAAEGNLRLSNANVKLDDSCENLYLGYYSFYYKDYCSVSSGEANMRLYWKPENGDDRHFQIDISIDAAMVYKKIDEQIGAENEEAARLKQKVKAPNRDKRAERFFNAEVRIIRERIFNILFGPVLSLSDDKRINDLQGKYLDGLPLAKRCP